MTWQILQTDQVVDFRNHLKSADPNTAELITAALLILADEGPALGRPLVDRIKGSTRTNMKELRPGSSGNTEIRILFVFDPKRRAVLLVAGDKSGSWSGWYKTAIREAEEAYEEHLNADT